MQLQHVVRWPRLRIIKTPCSVLTIRAHPIMDARRTRRVPCVVEINPDKDFLASHNILDDPVLPHSEDPSIDPRILRKDILRPRTAPSTQGSRYCMTRVIGEISETANSSSSGSSCLCSWSNVFGSDLGAHRAKAPKVIDLMLAAVGPVPTGSSPTPHGWAPDSRVGGPRGAGKNQRPGGLGEGPCSTLRGQSPTSVGQN